MFGSLHFQRSLYWMSPLMHRNTKQNTIKLKQNREDGQNDGQTDEQTWRAPRSAFIRPDGWKEKTDTDSLKQDDPQWDWGLVWMLLLPRGLCHRIASWKLTRFFLHVAITCVLHNPLAIRIQPPPPFSYHICKRKTWPCSHQHYKIAYKVNQKMQIDASLRRIKGQHQGLSSVSSQKSCDVEGEEKIICFCVCL